jgi:hypothetical protein
VPYERRVTAGSSRIVAFLASGTPGAFRRLRRIRSASRLSSARADLDGMFEFSDPGLDRLTPIPAIAPEPDRGDPSRSRLLIHPGARDPEHSGHLFRRKQRLAHTRIVRAVSGTFARGTRSTVATCSAVSSDSAIGECSGPNRSLSPRGIAATRQLWAALVAHSTPKKNCSRPCVGGGGALTRRRVAETRIRRGGALTYEPCPRFAPSVPGRVGGEG